MKFGTKPSLRCTPSSRVLAVPVAVCGSMAVMRCMVMSPVQKGWLLGPETHARHITLLFLVDERRPPEKHAGCQIDTIVASCLFISSLRCAFGSHAAYRFFGEYRNSSESHRFLVVPDCVFRQNGAMQNDALQQILMTASRERSER